MVNETQGVCGFKIQTAVGNNRNISNFCYRIKLYPYRVGYRDNKMHFQTDHGYSLRYDSGIVVRLIIMTSVNKAGKRIR